MRYKIAVLVEQDKDGFYAWCPALPGCQTQGDTMDEALGNIREAVSAYLDTLPEDERAQYVSQEVFNTTIEVDVA